MPPTKVASAQMGDKSSKTKDTATPVKGTEMPKKPRSKKLIDTPDAVAVSAMVEPSTASKSTTEVATDGPVRKGRRARNPVAQKEALIKESAEPKATGEQRAAASTKVSAKITAAPVSKAKKPRSKPLEVHSSTKPVMDEREVIASLSDVSDDEADDEDDEGNSSDEDEEDDKLAQRSSMVSIKLPNSKDDAVVKQRLDKLKKAKKSNKSTSTPGTLYVGRLPKGFFEDQMKAYFTQFGDVTRLRVSRNKKTGASKHYAFVEFADKDVANIVQETMNNYLIDGSLLQVRTVPKDKIHPEMWIGANKKFRPIPAARMERVKRSRNKTEEEQKVTIERTLNRQEKRKAKLIDAGIEYDFSGYERDGTTTATPDAKIDSKPTKKSKKAKISA